MSLTSTKNLKSLFFNESKETFLITDEFLNIVDVNAEFLKSLKKNREDIIGKNIVEINPNIKSTNRYKKYLQVLRTGKTVIINETRIEPGINFKKKDTIISIRIFKVKKGLGIAALDITQLSNTKYKLQKAKKKLIDTNKSLIKKNNELEEFSYIAAHDLKAPINNLNILLGLIDNEKYTDLVKTPNFIKLLKEVYQLNKNIYSLNNVIALEYYLKEKKEKINFSDIFKIVEKNLKKSIENTDTIINTNFSECPEISYPIDQLYKILFHLIDNSINFRNVHIKNIISIYTLIEKQKPVLIISDNGIGFNQIKNEKYIYKNFYKNDPTSERLGIGLFIVKSIINHHKGQIKVSSKINHGTTFKLTLK